MVNTISYPLTIDERSTLYCINEKEFIMYNLNADDILMVDGGGDGDHNQSEIWGGNIACGLFGAAVGGITKSPSLGTAAGIVCGIAADNLGGGGNGSSGPNHNGGAYHGHGGGMDGSTSGFGR